METVRAPEQRFARISAWPCAARSLELEEKGGPRLTYVAEGAREHRTVLMLHGGPTWSYLWRRVMPSLCEAGCRVVAPDLIGFGRSDKPARVRDCGAARQVAWLGELIERLDLRGAVMVVHGFSAGIGFELVRAHRERFTALVAICPVLDGRGLAVASLSGRLREDDDLSASELVAEGCAARLEDAARTAYDAPFPDEDHVAGLRALPGYLPEAEAWAEGALELPLLAVSGSEDAYGAPADWVDRFRGPVRERLVLAGAGHYAPEDRGPELALGVLGFVAQVTR